MTTLDVSLSSGFRGEVGSGAWVYAIAYDTYDTAGVITTLVADGTVQGDGTTVPVTMLNGTVAADTAFVSGKVYFVVQQSTTSAIGSEITQQSDLNITNAATKHFAYDSMEVNLSGLTGAAAAFDVANLTSVAGFALPMEISVPYNNGSTATTGYRVGANTLISDLVANEGTAGSDTRYFLQNGTTVSAFASLFPTALSPAAVISAATPNPPGVTFQSANWQSYVQGVGSLVNAGGVTLSGGYGGSPDAAKVYHNGGFFDYAVTYEPSATLMVGGTAETGVFLLTPQPNSQIQGVIAVTTSELENSIYSTLGTAEIFASTSAALSGAPPAYTIGTGANDQWGAVLRNFIVGFTAGYYGGSAKSVNPQVASTISLNTSINWDPTYAFGGTVSPTTTLVTNSITLSGTDQVAHDPYAQVFYNDTNSYGSDYSDALMNAYQAGGPQVSVYDLATQQDVATLDLTLFADNEQPAGYTTPTLYNYIAPQGGTYDLPDTTNGDNIGLYFGVPNANNAGMALNSLDAVTLEVMTSDAAGTPGWTPVVFNGASASNGGGLWNDWTITGNGSGGYTATAGATALKPANMLITGIPVVGTGTATEWYGIVVAGKTFDLYTVTQNGAFDNPKFAGQAGSIAVDGLGAIVAAALTGETVPTFNVNLANGAGAAFDPSALVVSPVLLAQDTPDAPVAGVMNNGTFESLAGQVNAASNTITVSTTAADLSVAFGWTGLNSLNPQPTTLDPSVTPWTNAYTNKIGALDTAEVTIAPVGDIAAAQTVSATADLDGNWQTGTIALGAGTTYDVTMNSYQAGVTAEAGGLAPLTPQSQTLELDLACFAAGTRILTARGEVAVENLAAGDLVWAQGGGLTPISWIGWRHVECEHYANPRDVAPVRVQRGAFGPDVPHRDLLLSPDHAAFVDGVLIPVRYLVNGRTVRREAAERVTYYHVELARHDVILAEGLACESYLDTGNRAIFANASGAKADDAFALGVWETDSCAPLVLKGEKLGALRRRLLERAEELGHAITRDPALRIVAGGRVLRGRRAGRVAWFRLPESARDVRLVSRSAVPAQTGAAGEDHRRLGVAVAGIRIDGETIGLHDPRLGAGWHRLEHCEGGAWRWTDGEADLALAGGRVLEVEVALTEAYWRDASAEEIA